MKYPRLPEKLDLRKKLMAQDIADIQQAFEDALPFPLMEFANYLYTIVDCLKED